MINSHRTASCAGELELCIEVEDAHPVDAEKLARYEDIWWMLDGYHWELHLISADRWGNLTPISIFEYGEWGKLDPRTPGFGNVLEVERDKNPIVFELSKIYCIENMQDREQARADWLLKYPAFRAQ
jgi:hypothetical protein